MKWVESIRRRKALKWVNRLANTIGYLVLATLVLSGFLLLFYAVGLIGELVGGGLISLSFLVGLLYLWGSLTIQQLEDEEEL